MVASAKRPRLQRSADPLHHPFRYLRTVGCCIGSRSICANPCASGPDEGTVAEAGQLARLVSKIPNRKTFALSLERASSKFMSGKTKVTPRKSEIREKEGRQVPLLDLSDMAAREFVRSAQKRGYVSHDRINALLASEEVNSEQIENILGPSSARWASPWSTPKRLVLGKMWQSMKRHRERLSRNAPT